VIAPTPDVRILFIDDSSLDIPLMIRSIEKTGYHVIWRQLDTEGALRLALQAEIWDIIVCDYVLPNLTVERALQVVHDITPHTPFLVVSGVILEDVAVPLMDKGAADFISKDRLFRLPLVIKKELRHIARHAQERIMVDQSFNSIITAWGTALELRDPNTHGHTLRVAEQSIQIAVRAGVDPSLLKTIYFGALLHDVGKLGIPDKILLKDGKLDDAEIKIMRTHPGIAKTFLERIPFLQDASIVAYSHHERYDGTGYPQGLKGEEIPLPARVFAIADVYDALRHDRPYRKAMSQEMALRVMKEMKDWFDPKLLEQFLENEGIE
jgi:response regulator RpfG family c-di-GMP phosphodiesterase